ncbi:protocatechuate 3,4-dioxygenase subunit beta [Ascidiaceihabitans sp.]|uniref:protocatechuate 3,4-dioxygenase subunit beta n=1 Tax=Ascidiaceihabitans sp. TaxID=1872644 RepID=UPI003297E952
MSDLLTPRPAGWHPPALAPDYKSSRLRSPQNKPLRMPTGPAELAGPTFGHDLIGPNDHNMIINYTGEMAIGSRLIVHGRVQDEDGQPVTGALIEAWQANAGGRYRHKNEGYLAPLDPNFGGCGRTITDDQGHYRFLTIQPGAYPWPNGPNSWRPAHIHFSLFGHSFAQRLITQMYFEGDPLISLCPIVQAIPSEQAVKTLVARLDMDANTPMDSIAYRFDMTLRGRDQTHFETKPEGS